ncbi:MAG: hypothetical protein KME16_02210 [Scytolyngbya sp. HA4215-MV1]|nr:hypothetical protein [Scytolyngbya sp. HA4215-MV1]
MQESAVTTWAERVESLKAGSLAALLAALFFGVTLMGNPLLIKWLMPLLMGQMAGSSSGWAAMSDLQLLTSEAIAGFSGFLFGVTYRYILRQDQNPHLKSGAILAFGLVRGLAQVDRVLVDQQSLLPCAILGLESILLFMVARVGLDTALQQGWIKPFAS